jgi:F-type H+-transporting ATPase subunit b
MTEAVTQPGLLASLGINLKLFLAQLLNFAILLVVLWRFAYKPLLNMMEARTHKIERGLKNATEAQVLRDRAGAEHAKALKDAEIQVRGLIEDAHKAAAKVREESLAETRSEIEKQIQAARTQLDAERATMMQALKKDVVRLVVQASEQVLGERVDEAQDEAYIQKVVKSLDQRS